MKSQLKAECINETVSQCILFFSFLLFFFNVDAFVFCYSEHVSEVYLICPPVGDNMSKDGGIAVGRYEEKENCVKED